MSVPTEFTADSGGRVKGLTIVKPIVYGNVARYFGKKREEDGHTHQWTVYVKPYSNEDMANYVKKVHFKLHESYANPNRIVTKPPYEVTETGWGEFEIVIKIYFHDPNERPTTMYHILKLFQSPVVEGNTSAASGGKKGLVSENYEEIVFQEPSQLMQHLLTSAKPLTHGAWTHDTDYPVDVSNTSTGSAGSALMMDTATMSETLAKEGVEEKKEKTLEKIINAKTKVRSDIAELKDKLKLAKETIIKFKDEISKQQSSQMPSMISL